MSSRFFLSLVLLAVCSAAGVRPLSAAEKQPNILLIMADDVGSDAIGCYGGQSYPTPHIDRLAKEGLKFTHGFAMPVCHPSRICLTTGCYPFRFGPDGSRWGDFPEVAEEHTIAHRLRQGGYATAVAGKWQLCMMKNDLTHAHRLGFEEFLLFGWHEGGRYHEPLLYQNGTLRDDTTGKFGPDLYVEFLIDFMERQHSAGKPFFAYYPMALCHDVTDDLKGELVAFFRDGRWMTYAEMVSAMDDMVGRLVAALNRMQIREETLIIFTTDNGTAAQSYFTVNEAGKMTKTKVVSVQNGKVVPGGKGKFDDTGTRVPWIANWPGTIESGQVSQRMVDLTDLLPTLAEVAGLPPDPHPRDGISFAPLLGGDPETLQERPWIFTELRGKRCARSRNFRLYDDGRFFDLKTDPLETTPLDSATLSPVAAENFAELQKALEQMQGPFVSTE
ncbi:MAG: sulfatase-like hydrolase/transferase [Planctomycetaceae bacterium]|nr:sulfatase-like hydrolase/transferase [Planctomycetaceae bacterium]